MFRYRPNVTSERKSGMSDRKRGGTIELHGVCQINRRLVLVLPPAYRIHTELAIHPYKRLDEVVFVGHLTKSGLGSKL